MRFTTILTTTALTALAAGCVEYTPTAKPAPVEQPAKTPTITAFRAATEVVTAGSPVTLSWQVTDAESVKITKAGVTVFQAPDASGAFETSAVNANTTWVLTAINKDKSATAEVSVSVMQVAIPLHASVDQFEATPVAIEVGGSATLRWRSTNAVSGKIMSGGTTVLTIATAELASGTFMVSPGATTSYTIEVMGTDTQPVERAINVEVNGMGGTTITGRDLFDRNVATLLQQKCASCHANTSPGDGPDFMGTSPNPTTWYTAIERTVTVIGAVPFIQVATPQDSPLIAKGEHTGPAFTPSEQATISAWLIKEAQERGLGTPVNPNPNPNPTVDYRPKNLREAIVRFTACMTRADWDQTVGQNQNTNVAYQGSTDGPCYACHATGTGGAYLSQNSGDTYDAHKNANAYYVLKLVLGTVNLDGSFKDLVPAYRFRDKGLPPFGTPPHPSYLLTANREQALDAFVDRTLLRFRDFTRACGQ
jgi:hypothetical protein